MQVMRLITNFNKKQNTTTTQRYKIVVKKLPARKKRNFEEKNKFVEYYCSQKKSLKRRNLKIEKLVLRKCFQQEIF